MNDITRKLDDIVSYGIAHDVYEARHAFALLCELDLFVEAIKRTGTGKHFIANIQRILQRHAILSVVRVFEDKSGRYPMRSIPAALSFMREHNSDLAINDSSAIYSMLDTSPTPTETPDTALTETLIDHVEACLNNTAPDSLAALRVFRHKVIAHHEDIEVSKLPSFNRVGFEELVELGDEFVIVIGRSYLNSINNLKQDAARSVSSLRRLLKEAGLQSTNATEVPPTDT